MLRQGLRTTSIERTLADLAWRLPLVDAVIVTDMALHIGLTDLPSLQSWANARRGVKGVRFFRCVIELADARAESPMESQLRVLLVKGGLPRPESQVKLFDERGSSRPRSSSSRRCA